MSEDARPLSISAVLFQESDGAWSAQCLEYDLAAQAKSLPDLRYEVERVVLSHVCVSLKLGREPFQHLGAAPQRFWDMYEEAKLRLESDDLPFRIPQRCSFPSVVPKLRVAKQGVPTAAHPQ